MKETDLRYVKTERAIRDAFFELLRRANLTRYPLRILPSEPRSTETHFTCITAINSIWSILF